MDMFGLWPGEKIIQVYWAHHPLPGINGLDAAKLDKQTILDAVKTFAPEVIYLRPADNHIEYARLTNLICASLNVPTVVHVMDDWPTRKDEKDHGEELVSSLNNLISQAHTGLTICREMSEEYARRYKQPFKSLANGVSQDTWGPLKKQATNPNFCIR